MKFFLSLVFLFLIPGSAIMCRQGFLLFIDHRDILIPMIYGAGGGLLIYYLIIKKLPWISTFEHELTHALVALMFLRRVTGFRVTAREGGMVTHKGKFGGISGDVLITLAPYFLPTLTLMAVSVRLLVDAKYIYIIDIIIGFTLIYHILSTFRELRNNWSGKAIQTGGGQVMLTDIRQSGYILSVLAILSLNLLFYGIIFYVLIYGAHGILTALKQVVSESLSVYIFLYKKLFP